MIQVRPATVADAAAWVRMREALWPEDDATGHAREAEHFFAGKLRMPLEVLLAVDGSGRPVGFAELSIRAYAEDCLTDRVAYLEGRYVEPTARQCRGTSRTRLRRDRPDSLLSETPVAAECCRMTLSGLGGH